MLKFYEGVGGGWRCALLLLLWFLFSRVSVFLVVFQQILIYYGLQLLSHRVFRVSQLLNKN